MLLPLRALSLAAAVSRPSVARYASPLACAEALQLQRDFGRGAYHLSAMLEDGDVIAYQAGTWLVDNVEVGDGTAARLHWARVECMQINWTTNGEHGWIRATGMDEVASKKGSLVLSDEDVEFGPEQLIARVAVEWDDAEQYARLLCDLPSHDALIIPGG